MFAGNAITSIVPRFWEGTIWTWLTATGWTLLGFWLKENVAVCPEETLEMVAADEPPTDDEALEPSDDDDAEEPEPVAVIKPFRVVVFVPEVLETERPTV